MNFEIINLRMKQEAFNNAVSLTHAMKTYELNKDENHLKEVMVLAKNSFGMPLPSGRWGNAIALALETGCYISAEKLIENAKELDLDTKTVVSELGWNNCWTLNDEFLFSLIIFNEKEQNEMLEFDSECLDEKTSKILKNKIRETFFAIDRIKKSLNVPEEEFQKMKRM